MLKTSTKNNPNKNNQLAIAKTDVKSTTHAFANIWVVECQECKTQYGSNGCDFQFRTEQLLPGDYILGIEMPDTRVYEAGFTLRP